jgi:hypothetical protein
MNFFHPFLHRGIALMAFAFMSFIYGTKAGHLLLIPLATVLGLSSIGCLLNGNFKATNQNHHAYWLAKYSYIEAALSLWSFIAYLSGWPVYEFILAIWVQSIGVISSYQLILRGEWNIKTHLLLLMMITFSLGAFWLYPVDLSLPRPTFAFINSIVLAMAGLCLLLFYMLNPLKNQKPIVQNFPKI